MEWGRRTAICTLTPPHTGSFIKTTWTLPGIAVQGFTRT